LYGLFIVNGKFLVVLIPDGVAQLVGHWIASQWSQVRLPIRATGVFLVVNFRAPKDLVEVHASGPDALGHKKNKSWFLA